MAIFVLLCMHIFSLSICATSRKVNCLRFRTGVLHSTCSQRKKQKRFSHMRTNVFVEVPINQAGTRVVGLFFLQTSGSRCRHYLVGCVFIVLSLVHQSHSFIWSLVPSNGKVSELESLRSSPIRTRLARRFPTLV